LAEEAAEEGVSVEKFEAAASVDLFLAFLLSDSIDIDDGF
jgi:hypothetical protein